jgi:hypothetical protein
MTDLKSIARIAVITFVSAFFAALTFVGIPGSLSEAKAVIAPALIAALLAEIVYLRKVFAKALAEAASGSLGPSGGTTASSVSTSTTVTQVAAAPPPPDGGAS